MTELTLENLGDEHIYAILGHFQTNCFVDFGNNSGSGSDKYLTDYDKMNIIHSKRYELVETHGIQTDIVSIVKFSELCKRFYDIVHKSDYGRTLFTVMYHSEDPGKNANVSLEHIKCCSHKNCDNICHYVSKYIDHTNLFHKLATNSFNKLKNIPHAEDLVNKYKHHLTWKQIESYYKNKKEST